MAFRTPFTPLYADVLDYLNRGSTIRGLPSIAGIFDDYDASKNNRLGIFDEEETTTKSTGPIGIPAAPMNQMRDGDGPRGEGLFGNLDPQSKKTVLINGVPTEVYRDITSGLLKTYDGKNVKDYQMPFDPSNPGGLSVGFDEYGIGTIHPFSEGYRGAALKAADDFREAEKIRIAEEAAAAAREQAAAEAAKREAQRKQIQDLQNKIDQGQYGGGGGGGTGSGGRGTTSNPGRDPGSYGGGRDMGSTSSGGYGSGKDRGSSLHG